MPEIPERLVVEQLPQRLYELRPKYLSYVLSFVVILMYRMAHHSTFRAIRRYDRVLIWLNSLFLMCIAFLPFPTSLLGEYGDHQLAVVIYAGSLAVARLLLAAVWWYASSGHRLIDEKVSPSMIRAYRIRGLVIPLVFLTSIGISFFSLNAAMYSGVAAARRRHRAPPRAEPVRLVRGPPDEIELPGSKLPSEAPLAFTDELS